MKSKRKVSSHYVCHPSRFSESCPGSVTHHYDTMTALSCCCHSLIPGTDKSSDGTIVWPVETPQENDSSLSFHFTAVTHSYAGQTLLALLQDCFRSGSFVKFGNAPTGIFFNQYWSTIYNITLLINTFLSGVTFKMAAKIIKNMLYEKGVITVKFRVTVSILFLLKNNEPLTSNMPKIVHWD